MEIKITINKHTFLAELDDSFTAKAIFDNLPSKSTASKWGDEIYFGIKTKNEIQTSTDAKQVLEVGDIAYYPPMKVLCLFFGPTPMSTNEKPVAADRVNVCGKLIDPDIDLLKKCKDGDLVVVEAGL